MCNLFQTQKVPPAARCNALRAAEIWQLNFVDGALDTRRLPALYLPASFQEESRACLLNFPRRFQRIAALFPDQPFRRTCTRVRKKKKRKKPRTSGRTFDKGEVERETTESRRTKLDSRGKCRWSRVDYLSRQRNGKVLSRRLCVAGQKARQEKADCSSKGGETERKGRRSNGKRGEKETERKLFRPFLGTLQTQLCENCNDTPPRPYLIPVPPSRFVFHPRDVDGQG